MALADVSHLTHKLARRGVHYYLLSSTSSCGNDDLNEMSSKIQILENRRVGPLACGGKIASRTYCPRE